MKRDIAFARTLRKRMTPEEVKLWVRLREWRASHGFHFRRQAPVDGYVLDFLCKSHKVIVEVDGSQVVWRATPAAMLISGTKAIVC